MKAKSPATPQTEALSAAIREFTLGEAPGHLLRRCHQRSEELFTEAVGTDGPTRQQVALLLTVCQNPELSQAELAGLTGIDKNTLTHMISRLLGRGLLERRRASDDGRSNAISATPAAVRLLEEVLPRVRRVQEQILEPVPEALRPIFQQCLRLVAGLDTPGVAPVVRLRGKARR
jgi:DNA-binding MarR family transcriptional regulator